MATKYILQDGVPVPASDMHLWAYWYATADDERRVGDTQVGSRRVSTVFLGMDHGWGGEVLLYETMVFGDDEERCERYGTLAEAQAGHRRIVDQLRAEVEGQE